MRLKKGNTDGAEYEMNIYAWYMDQIITSDQLSLQNTPKVSPMSRFIKLSYTFFLVLKYFILLCYTWSI